MICKTWVANRDDISDTFIHGCEIAILWTAAKLHSRLRLYYKKFNFRMAMPFFSHRKMFRECEKRIQRHNGTSITKKGRLMHALKAVLRTVKEKNTRSQSTEEILICQKPDINHLWQHTSERKKQNIFFIAHLKYGIHPGKHIAFKRLLIIHRNVTWHEGCW